MCCVLLCARATLHVLPLAWSRNRVVCRCIMCVGVQSRAHMRLTTHPDPEPSCDAAKGVNIKRAKNFLISP